MPTEADMAVPVNNNKLGFVQLRDILMRCCASPRTRIIDKMNRMAPFKTYYGKR